MPDQADKNDSEKIPVELVPAQFIEDIAKVLGHGAKKYGENNWRAGLPWTRIYGAALRHLLAWGRGEDVDKESGMSHLTHCATNLLFLILWKDSKPELDNRYEKQKTKM